MVFWVKLKHLSPMWKSNARSTAHELTYNTYFLLVHSQLDYGDFDDVSVVEDSSEDEAVRAELYLKHKLIKDKNFCHNLFLVFPVFI